MLSAACPSCGAPIRFAHAAAIATICERCRSTVVRGDRDLALAGHASVFVRDLSPIELGVRGKIAGRGFVVAGVVRKARERVRWNEWFVIFDSPGIPGSQPGNGDTKTGWIGEGNGEFQIYDRWVELPTTIPQLRAGADVRIGGVVWQVIEAHSARIVAADGELPFAATDESATFYADLRLGDGRTAATLDTAFDPPRMFTGRVVTLAELGLERIRPFTGWTDPDLQAAMTGPEITGARALVCPNCNAPLQLRSPDTQTVVCGHCGSAIGVDESALLGVVSRFEETQLWKPTLPLGSRGRLRGIEWEIIGIMDRFVRFEGQRFVWTEYLLFNPYRGYRWLVEDHGTRHWNLVERLPDLPRRSSERRASHAGHSYLAYQQGKAEVARVIGEFTWEVRAGDLVDTVDYVDPPYMLSIETADGEQAASLGEWIDRREVEDAFPGAELHGTSGIAPNQRNPYDLRGTILGFTAGGVLFSLAAVALFVGQLIWSANEPLLSWKGSLDADGTTAVQVSEPFVIPDVLRRNVSVALTSTLDPQNAIVHLTLLNRDDGIAYQVATGRTSGEGHVPGPGPGNYVVVAEADSAAPGILDGHSVTVEVVRDRPSFLPVVLAFLAALLGPVWWFLGRTLFESRRWQNSDFAS